MSLAPPLPDERRPAAVRARAPIRLDLAGGWTDVPPFSEREGGAVVNLAITRYCYVTAQAQDSGVSLQSEDYGRTVEAPAAGDLSYNGELDLLKAAVRLAWMAAPGSAASGGMRLFCGSDAPPGSGTGSSGAVGVALVGALAACAGRRLAPHEAARLAWQAERHELGVAGGTQDQYAAAYGGANFMEFHDPSIVVSPLRLAPATVAELEKRLVLCYTGLSRVSGDIVDAVMGAYRQGLPRTVDALRTLRRLADDVKTLLLRGDLSGLGEALSDNWRCQQDLHPSVTTPEIEHLWQRAAAAGAQGGKALGAGGGGCVLFIAAADREGALRRALADAGAHLMECTLDWRGLEVWDARVY